MTEDTPEGFRRIPVGARNQPVGEASTSCKYSDATVERARQLSEQGLTQREIGRLLNLNCRSVSNWVNGRSRKPPLRQALRLV